MSRFLRPLRGALLVPMLLAAMAAGARAGGLELVEAQVDGVGGISDLAGAESIAISPGDEFVYVGASEADAIVIFRRDRTTGRLTQVGSVLDDHGGVDGLNEVQGLAISPDGANLYAASHIDNAVAVFARDEDTGLLTFVEMKKDGAGGITKLAGAMGISVSPDGRHVYVASNVDDAVVVFRRDGSTGQLTLVEELVDGAGGITSLEGAEMITVSPDGQHVYVASEDDNTITVFARDDDGGALTLVEVKQDGVGGMTALDRVQALAVSPDGAHVYAVSGDDNALVVFARDEDSGALTLIEAHRDGVAGINGLDGAEWVTVSPNGAYVYAVGDVDDALVVFLRDAATGRLTYLETHKDGVGGVNHLEDVEAVAVTSDSTSVYTVADLDDAISVFGNLCGNGRADAGEACDDGNTADGDCCTAACAVVAAGAACPDDGNVCTNDVCNGAGVCLHTNNTVPCDDGAFCTVGDVCEDGVCGGTARDCSAAGDQCNIGVCDESSDRCVPQARADGTACTDGNACTQVDTCQAGICAGASPVVCAAQDQCHVAGTCNPATGVCSNPEKANGSACDDGNACTQTDTCQAGICAGSNPVVCTAQDQCHVAGTCNPATGTCSNPAKANGSACTDGNACTQVDTCQTGTCVGASPVVCTAQDQCHVAGTCNPATGTCSNPEKTNGSACSDGNACTQVDTCQTGVCVGASPVACAALDQCHVAGTCNPATGTCSNPDKANGSACDDGNACTRTDTCQAGACVGASPVACAAQDQCHVAGTCNPATGTCSNPEKTNGSACSDGNACTQVDTCQTGVCVGASPVACAALDQCHVAGTCNPATGTCSNPDKANGSACDDGNACTRTDTCQAGACVGASPVACTAQDQCHVAGTCNPATGTCSNPLKANFAPCNDGDACTRTDACLAGVCVGADPVVCTASDQCHDAGVCDPATGRCSDPARPDETVLSFAADADAYTDSSMPSTNFGAASTLRVDESPDRRVYLRFTAAGISGQAIRTAVVRLYTTSDATAGSDQGGDLYAVAANSWAERMVTHANRPALEGEVLASAGSVEPSQAVEFDVTGYVTVDGTYDFAIAGVSENVTIYRSREATTNHPELVIYLASGCDDGDACTQWDTCIGGACLGADPVVCAAADQCHDAGVCNPATGVCSNPETAEGVPCDDGNLCTQSDACLAGICVGANPVVCTPADQCHDAGVCDPETGTCSDPEKADGIGCDDGSACTRVDVCAAGICTGTDAIVCTAQDQCHVAGVCNPATGMCSNPAAANGAACDDGNACTQEDTCRAGTCRGGDPVVCEAAGQCHGAGVCNPTTGECTSEAKPDGIVCDDGDACTSDDVCSGGRCVGIGSPDSDGDGTCDAIDVCPDFPDANQWDTDGDGIGDACQCNMPIPGRCIAGGGSSRTDCFLEMITRGPVRYNRKHTRIKYVLQCYDGQAECDADGARDGQCTFTVGLCFGNADPRFPRCNPEDVAGLEVVSPHVSRAASTDGRSNAKRLEDAIAALGLEVRRRGQTIAPSVAPMGEGICGPAINLVTPAPEFGKKVVRRKFKIRARSASGRVDTDRFVLVCK